LAGKDAAKVVEECVAGGLSFVATTVVATSRGEQAIGTLTVGEKVWAYNPSTRKMEMQPILHVWINHDNDLVDLTIIYQKEVKRMGTNVELDIFLKKEGFSLQPILSLLKMEGLYVSIQEMRVFDDWNYTNEMNIDTASIDISTSNIFLERFTLIHFIVNSHWRCVLITSLIEDAYIDLSFGLDVDSLKIIDKDISI
jgi:hypothetical protein